MMKDIECEIQEICKSPMWERNQNAGNTEYLDNGRENETLRCNLLVRGLGLFYNRITKITLPY